MNISFVTLLSNVYKSLKINLKHKTCNSGVLVVKFSQWTFSVCRYHFLRATQSY